MAKTKTTSKGTELPMMSLKGKDYLEVKYRLVWFREDHPTGLILTSRAETGPDWALYRAEIYAMVDGRQVLLASGHKRECSENFGDYEEKAETGAIGRALAIAGYGTQFDPELEEGDRIVDAPAEPVRKANGKADTPKAVAKSREPSRDEAETVAPVAPKGPANGGEEGRETINLLISKSAQVLVAQKRKTQADLKTELKTRYGVDTKEGLSDAQAKEFLAYLRGLLQPQAEAVA